MDRNFLRKGVVCFLLLVTGLTAWANPADSLVTHRKDSVFTFSPATAPLGREAMWFDEPADVLYDGMNAASVSNDSIQRKIDLARTVIQKVRDLGAWITRIDEATKVELPVGISRKIAGINYDIAIHAIRLKPAYAEIDVFMQIDVPQGQTLTFMATGIKFTKKGGIVGDAKLELLGDYGINFNGDKVQLLLKGTSGSQGTYAVMDCDGFRELSLDASVKFSRDLLRPDSPNGKPGTGNVQADFKTVLTDWNDLVVQISLPNFQVTGLDGVGFSVQDAVFDFSDIRNAPAVVFPTDYQSTQFLSDNKNLWRGFYMREMTVSLPPEFKSNGSSTRTNFRAENVLIDNMGVTGKFTGENIITMDKGDMSGWAFSIDKINIELRANQLVEAGLNGGLVIPIGKEDQPFEYKAIINTGGNYLFSVSPTNKMTFPLWGAGKVDIYESSYLDIRIQDGKFLPKASLSGRMSIAAKLSEGGQGAELANISFEALEIQAVKPYIKVGFFSFGSEAAQQKMAGFPISIQDIGLKSLGDTEMGLNFTLKLNLVGEDAGSFAADAGLTLVGRIDEGKGIQSWKFKTVQVNEIGVDIDGGAFKINGRLIFYRNDVVYGDGFNGTVKAEFTPGLKVTATAIFGSVTGMRYWYADALVQFPTGIPVFTGVGIFGFGGGAYYGMKMDNQGLGSELGRTASGVIYVPDKKAGLGLKAIVTLASHPKPEAFTADVTFEIAFFKGGGVRYIAFGGNGYIATPGLDVGLDKIKAATNKMTGVVKKMEGKMSDATMGLVKADGGKNSTDEIFGDLSKGGQKGQISAKVMIDYDFENRVLHGNFEVFINVAGGIIQGVGAGGRAGWAVLHFAPQEWYVWVGTPDDRCGVSVGVGPIRATATSYFMVGTKIMGSPPPPPQVARTLGVSPESLNYMGDLNSIAKGGGFAFGAALSLSTGDLSFLMFYAKFEAGAGFDIMLRDYGDLHCKGSSDVIGINGWYANGQAYAYFEGDIGIRVKVFGRKKSISILEIGAAALLQAKLPNPFWMRGIVGGHFSVLGGLVKGNCKFQVTLGKECELERDAAALLDDIKIISQLTPGTGESDVNVFNTPQALFNIPPNKEFELTDELDNSRHLFRVKLDHFKLLDEKREVVGTLEWNENNDVLAFNSYEILPSQKELKLVAQVSFEERKNGNWAPVVSEGKRYTEVMESTFTSGIAPDYLPHENIEFSYPVLGHANFYKDETKEGYIKLRKAMPDLFNPGAEWKQVARLTGADGQVVTFDFAYTYSTNRVTFAIPSGIKNNQVYTWELVNVPAQKNTAIDRNVTTVNTEVKVDGQVSDTQIATKQAEGNIETLEEKQIYASYLRSSTYSSFSQKIDAFDQTRGWTWPLSIQVDELGTTLKGAEYFDKFELGSEAGTGLVRLEADLTDNRWYNNQIFPITYQAYPIRGKGTITRNPNTLGLPPVKAVYLRQFPADMMITDENGQAGTANLPTPLQADLVYNLALEMYRDYMEIKTKCANLSIDEFNDDVNRVLMSSFPLTTEGDYKIKLKYVLPGTTAPSTEKIRTIHYTIDKGN